MFFLVSYVFNKRLFFRSEYGQRFYTWDVLNLCYPLLSESLGFAESKIIDQ